MYSNVIGPIVYGRAAEEKEAGWIWNGISNKFDLIMLSEFGTVRIVESEKQPE